MLSPLIANGEIFLQNGGKVMKFDFTKNEQLQESGFAAIKGNELFN